MVGGQHWADWEGMFDELQRQQKMYLAEAVHQRHQIMGSGPCPCDNCKDMRERRDRREGNMPSYTGHDGYYEDEYGRSKATTSKFLKGGNKAASSEVSLRASAEEEAQKAELQRMADVLKDTNVLGSEHRVVTRVGNPMRHEAEDHLAVCRAHGFFGEGEAAEAEYQARMAAVGKAQTAKEVNALLRDLPNKGFMDPEPAPPHVGVGTLVVKKYRNSTPAKVTASLAGAVLAAMLGIVPGVSLAEAHVHMWAGPIAALAGSIAIGVIGFIVAIASLCVTLDN